MFGCLLVNEITLKIVYVITYLAVLDKLFPPWLLLFSTLSKVIAIMMKVMVNILILLIKILWIAIRKEITKSFGKNFVSLKTKSESVELFLFYCYEKNRKINLLMVSRKIISGVCKFGHK